MSKFKPLPLTAPLALAAREGRKTNTRRPLSQKAPAGASVDLFDAGMPSMGWAFFRKVNGCWEDTRIRTRFQPGDVLWLREPGRSEGVLQGSRRIDVKYVSDGALADIEFPSRLIRNGEYPLWAKHMKGIPNGIFKEACRAWFRVTTVRVERLRDITGRGVLAEGLNSYVHPNADYFSARQIELFERTWNDIYAKRALGWKDNPWVEVAVFKRTDKPEGWPC